MKRPRSGARGSRRGCVLEFDHHARKEFLTGFHQRKVERRRVALEEVKKQLKQERKRLRDERRQEALKLLQERQEALDEADELEEAITATSESVQYDHPNHTVTVTTVCNLDLSASRLLETEAGPMGGLKLKSIRRTPPNPALSQKVQVLTAALNVKNKRSRKRKFRQDVNRCGRHTDRKSLPPSDNKPRFRKTTKTQRRRQTGMRERNQD